MNCPQLESTPGEGETSYRSTDWSAERHTSGRTLSVSGMNCLPCAVALLPADKLYATIQRNDTAVCVEIDSPADMNAAVMEMDDELSSGGDCRRQKCLPKVWRKSILHHVQILCQLHIIV